MSGWLDWLSTTYLLQTEINSKGLWHFFIPNTNRHSLLKISSFKTLNQMADRNTTMPFQERAADKKLQLMSCTFYVTTFLQKTRNVQLSPVPHF
jgi:hypothetical protein